MRLRVTLLVAALALALGACGNPSAPAAAIEVTDVWSRPALGVPAAQATDALDGPTAIVYLTIRNTGSAADRLLKAESPVAGVAELHTSMDSNGVMSMRPVEQIEIPAGGTVMLDPGGFHIMLIGLKRDLTLDATFDVVLRFEHAGAITVQSHVR